MQDIKKGIPVYTPEGKVSELYNKYVEQQIANIRERYINSIDIHQFEQDGRQCGVRVNFFDADELMKVIEEGAKALNMKERVWLTGYLRP